MSSLRTKISIETGSNSHSRLPCVERTTFNIISTDVPILLSFSSPKFVSFTSRANRASRLPPIPSQIEEGACCRAVEHRARRRSGSRDSGEGIVSEIDERTKSEMACSSKRGLADRIRPYRSSGTYRDDFEVVAPNPCGTFDCSSQSTSHFYYSFVFQYSRPLFLHKRIVERCVQIEHLGFRC